MFWEPVLPVYFLLCWQLSVWGNGTWPGWHFLSCSKNWVSNRSVSSALCSLHTQCKGQNVSRDSLYCVTLLWHCTFVWQNIEWLFEILSTLLTDTMVNRTGLHRSSQDVVSVCLVETTDLQEQLPLSQGDRGLAVLLWGLKLRDLIITALLLSKDDFLLSYACQPKLLHWTSL